MSNKTAHPSGFTLVELLLVISIMVILAGAMIPSFSSYLRSQTLKQAQERLKSDIRSVQNKALTGALYDKTVDIGGAAVPVTHWGIRFQNGTPNYYYFVAAITSTAQMTSECDAYSSVALGNGSVVRYQGMGSLPPDLDFKSTSGCLFFDFRNGTPKPSARNNGGAINGTTSPIYFGFNTTNVNGNCRNMRFNYSGAIFNTNNSNCSCTDYSANNYLNCQ